MHKILQDIINKKRHDIAHLKKVAPLLAGNPPAKEKGRFHKALTSSTTTPIIAEIKLASPTHPHLGKTIDIVKRPQEYQAGGAAALSFITETHYFKSETSHILLLKKSCALPILQKDFVIDEYQIHQAATLGSDALLLIARIVDTETLKYFVTLTQKLGIEPVVEINNHHDLEKALATSARCIAVNARNLETFSIDIRAACNLMSYIPESYLRLGFSGVHSHKEVQQYTAHGADAVLVGTSLMQANDIHQKLMELRS